MSLSLQQWLTGPDVWQVLITPLSISIAGDGTRSVATTADFIDYTGYFTDIDFQPKTRKRNLAPSGQRGANNQIVETDWTLTLSGQVLNRTGGSVVFKPAQPLMYMWDNYDLFQIQISKAGATAVFYGSKADGSDRTEKEVNTESLSFDRIELPGIVNPSWA